MSGSDPAMQGMGFFNGLQGYNGPTSHGMPPSNAPYHVSHHSPFHAQVPPNGRLFPQCNRSSNPNVSGVNGVIANYTISPPWSSQLSQIDMPPTMSNNGFGSQGMHGGCSGKSNGRSFNQELAAGGEGPLALDSSGGDPAGAVASGAARLLEEINVRASGYDTSKEAIESLE